MLAFPLPFERSKPTYCGLTGKQIKKGIAYFVALASLATIVVACAHFGINAEPGKSIAFAAVVPLAGAAAYIYRSQRNEERAEEHMRRHSLTQPLIITADRS